MKILFLVLVIMVICFGCCSEAERQRDDQKRMAIQACIDRGGVPIIDTWGNLTDCKFPPPKEK
jgi:uncharacterized protein YcfL